MLRRPSQEEWRREELLSVKSKKILLPPVLL
jgi:hypothetical protein